MTSDLAAVVFLLIVAGAVLAYIALTDEPEHPEEESRPEVDRDGSDTSQQR